MGGLQRERARECGRRKEGSEADMEKTWEEQSIDPRRVQGAERAGWREMKEGEFRK